MSETSNFIPNPNRDRHNAFPEVGSNEGDFESAPRTNEAEISPAGEVAAAIVVMALLGGLGYAGYSKIESDERAQDLERQAQVATAEQLHRDGSRLSLSDGKVVSLKGLPFAEAQIAGVVNNTDFHYQNPSRPYAEDSESPFMATVAKTHSYTTGGQIISTKPYYKLPTQTVTETVAYDDSTLVHIPRDELDRKAINVYVGATVETEGVNGQLYYDEESENLVLRTIFEKDTPNDFIQLVVSVDGVESN